MLFDDTYRTIARPAEGLFRDKGSKFLAFAYPVRSESEAKTYLDALRKVHPKANHHCYAYRLGLDKNNYRASDDGEPGGTAGRPILNTLYSHELTNILVVVVRYFGGTLLGVPGLINAYKSSTVEVLSVAEVIEKTVNERYRIVFGFERMNDVMKIVKDMQLTVLGQTYDNECTLRIELRKSLVNQVLGRFEKLDDVTTRWIDE